MDEVKRTLKDWLAEDTALRLDVENVFATEVLTPVDIERITAQFAVVDEKKQEYEAALIAAGFRS